VDRLIEGYRQFRRGAWQEHRERFEMLAERGQSPRALVIACSDSRVDPQMIFGAAPGELFVVRNVANLVPPHEPDAAYHGTSAAVEFAVRGLGVRDILVLGHAGCGGIAALMRGTGPAVGEFVGPWMSIADEARRRAVAVEAGHGMEAAQTLCEYEAIKVSLANLLTFPWIRERVDGGTLALHGAYFGIEAGTLEWLGPDGAFRGV
jgi:carbonic anhydrase